MDISSVAACCHKVLVVLVAPAAGGKRSEISVRYKTNDTQHVRTGMEGQKAQRNHPNFSAVTEKAPLCRTGTRAERLTANGKAINHQLVWLLLSVPDTNTPTLWAMFPYMNVAWILMSSNAWTRAGCSRLINEQMAGALWVAVLSVFTFRTWAGEG